MNKTQRIIIICASIASFLLVAFYGILQYNSLQSDSALFPEQSTLLEVTLPSENSEASTTSSTVVAQRTLSIEEPPAIAHGEHYCFKGNLPIGFQSILQETSLLTLPTIGTFPSWLKGSFIGVGPALFDINKHTVKYWFDGLAMLHSFDFQNGAVNYSNAFLTSTHYEKCIKNGKFPAASVVDQPKKSFFSKLGNAFSTPPIYDNCNVMLHNINDNLIAVTETPHAFCINPKTLQINNPYMLNSKLDGHITSAYPQYDPATKKWYNYLTEFGNNSLYHFYSIDDQNTVHKITSISTKNPAYMRSFGMTKNYFILVETPLVVNPYDLLFAAGSFIEEFKWQPQRGTIFTIINKHTDSIIGTYNSPAFFMLHTINAFERDNTITLDCITYNDPAVIKGLELKTLRSTEKNTYPASFPTSYIIDLKEKTITTKQLSQHTLEWPAINTNYNTKEYSYLYGIGSEHPHEFAYQLIKVNKATTDTITWQEQGCYPSKPLFIASSTPKTEDDGIILSVVLDSLERRSFLVCLDAQTFKERARALLPHHIPLGLQGTFIAS